MDGGDAPSAARRTRQPPLLSGVFPSAQRPWVEALEPGEGGQWSRSIRGRGLSRRWRGGCPVQEGGEISATAYPEARLVTFNLLHYIYAYIYIYMYFLIYVYIMPV